MMSPPQSLTSKKAEPPQLNKTDAPAPSPAPLVVHERPEWSGAPNREDLPYTIEVLKTGTIIDTVDVAGREAFRRNKPFRTNHAHTHTHTHTHLRILLYTN
jgi:hypothetical protein